MNPRFAKPLLRLTAELAETLRPMLTDQYFSAALTPEQINQLKQASKLDDRALRLALLPFAAAYSVAPISHFYVGAIACGLSGHWYFGANMEFAGQGLFHSVHAEQSAIANAWLHGEQGISEITVNYTPCGHCRQFMNELTTAKILKIALPDDLSALQTFLPHSFGPSDLNINDALMSKQHHQQLQSDENDPLLQLALQQAQQSYAPYSQGYAGVALEFANGAVCYGRYAENAAFNPSLPPMQMACSHGVLTGQDLTTICRAILVEHKDGQISHKEAAQSALRALVDIPLEYVAL